MIARDDIANVLAFAGGGLEGHTWGTLSDASRDVWRTKADVLLASPVLARLLNEARAEGWERRHYPESYSDKQVNVVLPERRREGCVHDRDCAGWEDCYCFNYLNPYRQENP